MPTTRGQVHELARELLLLRDRITQHIAALPTSELEQAHPGVRDYLISLVEVVKMSRAGMMRAMDQGHYIEADSYRRMVYNAVYQLCEYFE